MSSLDEIKTRDSRVMMQTYGRYPLSVSKAVGSRLYDLDGREYIDLLSGIAVASLGHSRPELIRVMQEQAEKLIHVSNLFYQEEQLDLAERLLSTCDADRVFFSNSGAEANEGAIKLARRYMRKVKNRDAYEIITLSGSFHGRTMATLTATGQPGPIKDGFDPLPQGFVTVPFDDIKALEEAVCDKTAAIMIEMVQGEGGIRPLGLDYVQNVTKICKKNNILLIIDEVQSGMCRTGKFWAHQHYGIIPDIFTSAKALANGLPMGAVLATEEAAKGFQPGSHATTFGGSGLLAAVACEVVDIMNRDKLADRAAEMGTYILNKADSLKEKHPGKISGRRGLGLMIGIELSFPGKEVWSALLDKGFVLNLTQERVLRLLPALTINKDDIDSFFIALDQVLTEL